MDLQAALAAVVYATGAPVLAAFHLMRLLGRGTPFWTPLMTWTGIELTAAGYLMAVVAQNTMSSSWRIGVDDAERTDLARSEKPS